jgi:RNA polymerase sigma-70 factor (ECF subfamily)
MRDALNAMDTLLERIDRGDQEALGDLFDSYRPRLRRMVQFRMDARVAARLDPSDVLQEAYLDAAQQIRHYLDRRDVDVYVWLRGLTWQRLLKLHRTHLGTQCRSVEREQPLADDSSVAVAQRLLARGHGPDQPLLQEEIRQRVQNALSLLDPHDREVILMREVEDLSNSEVAQVLGLSPSVATMRYGRALFRLQKVLALDSGEAGAEQTCAAGPGKPAG